MLLEKFDWKEGRQYLRSTKMKHSFVISADSTVSFPQASIRPFDLEYTYHKDQVD